MSRGLFVTGTDTAIGKTLVTAGLVRALRKLGIDVVPMKPVQTGAMRRGTQLVAPDLEVCFEAAELLPDPDDLRMMSPFLYEPACSPHLAGRMAGSYPGVSMIIKCANRLLEKHRAIIVEGAGGVMVPLNENETMLDLMIAFSYPVVLVARIGLGSINHSLLSIEALRVAGLEVAGVIFNQPEAPVPEDRFIEEDNPATVARFGRIDVLGNLGHLDLSLGAQETWTVFERSMPGINRLRELLEISGV